MKRGYYLLIGGAAILVAGIVLAAVWAVPIAQQIERDTSSLEGTRLAPGESQTITLQVTDITRPLSVAISASNDSPVNALLLDPEGRPGINSTFTGANFQTAPATVQGSYRLTVTNQGDEATEVDVLFGHLPGVGQSGPNVEMFSGLLVGVGMVIAGIVVMAVGVVVVIVDRRSK